VSLEPKLENRPYKARVFTDPDGVPVLMITWTRRGTAWRSRCVCKMEDRAEWVEMASDIADALNGVPLVIADTPPPKPKRSLLDIDVGWTAIAAAVTMYVWYLLLR